MSETMIRPNDLAREIGISPKTLRAWLRKTFRHEKGTHWYLTPVQASEARLHWGQNV